MLLENHKNLCHGTILMHISAVVIQDISKLDRSSCPILDLIPPPVRHACANIK